MRRTALLWLTVAAISIASCSRTEDTKGTSPVGTGGAGADVKSDGDFVHDVAIMNQAEIELSRLALAQATMPDIKSFAQRMIDDHGAARSKLQSAVSGELIEWPDRLDDKHSKRAADLAKKQGEDFDRDYVKAMVDGHQNFAALLESRLDVQSLADWKTAAAARTHTKALPEPDVA